MKFSKYEGSGNDFLILVDENREQSITPELVALLADRHFGLGADGVIRLSGSNNPSASVSMELWNADGGMAEMSGNGIRCLAKAAIDLEMAKPPKFGVETLTGIRHISVQTGKDLRFHGSCVLSVTMGTVQIGTEIDPPKGASRAQYATGDNPHLVVLVDHDLSDYDVEGIGRKFDQASPIGMNVEFIMVPEHQQSSMGDVEELDFRVFERGVGQTLACGTGSCAAAVVAHEWGIVGHDVVIHNPGGPLEVVIGKTKSDSVTLKGPVRKIADITVTPNELNNGFIPRVKSVAR